MIEAREAAGVREVEAVRVRVLMVMVGIFVAFWPVLGWWSRRVGDDSDEPLGVLALICAIGFVWRERRRVSVTRWALGVGMVLMVEIRMVSGEVPMLVRGMGFVAVLVVGLRLWVLPGVVMLLSLALPWVATLQFVAGYPLRVVVAMGAEKVLRVLGVLVTREGTDLWYQGVAVGVDAPCSGIRMLWFLLFAAAFLAARFGLRWGRTVLLMLVAGGLALVANGVRATVLFFPEAGLVEWPHWTHEGTGVVLFLPCLGLLMGLAGRWERRSQSGGVGRQVGRGWMVAFGVVCVGVAMTWGVQGKAPMAPVEGLKVVWPESFRGMPLEPMPLSVREEHFAAGFPGALGRFRCGEGEVIFRRVDRATRMLHSAEDCFKAAGFEMKRQSGQAEAGDGLWQVWKAKRGEERELVVCEQIRSASGDLFTDVSAWYWRALRHPEEGPWTAVTWVRFGQD